MPNYFYAYYLFLSKDFIIFSNRKNIRRKLLYDK